MEPGESNAGDLPFVQLPELYGHSRMAFALEFNRDGSLLASGSSDKSVRIWSPNHPNKDATELRGHSESVNSLAWDPTSNYRVASTSADKTVRIWDAKSGRLQHSISLQAEALNIVYSHDGKWIAVSNLDCVTLIDAKKHRVVRRVVNPYEVNEVQFNQNGLLFVAAGHPAGYGTFEIMKILTEKKGNPNLENVHKVMAHAGSCFCLDFHPSGRYVAIGGIDSLVSLWDLHNLYCIRTFVVTSSSIRIVRFNFDGSLLAIGMDETNLIVVHTDTGEIALTLQLQNGLQYLCWHPKQNVLAYVGDKATGEKNSHRDGVIKQIEVRGSSG